MESHFMKDLGLDSLDQVEVIMAMEDEFGECLLTSSFYTPVEDGTYAITCGGRAASPIPCPEDISKTMLAMIMKFHGWIDLIKAECSAQEP